jgi:hypothetical protein
MSLHEEGFVYCEQQEQYGDSAEHEDHTQADFFFGDGSVYGLAGVHEEPAEYGDQVQDGGEDEE